MFRLVEKVRMMPEVQYIERNGVSSFSIHKAFHHYLHYRS